MLHRHDTDDASYVELPEFITQWGDPSWIDMDLREMFTRLVFNVATANRDDHLRNHGFIRLPDGWHLSPAFDMNPSFKKDEHALALDLYSTQPDLEAVLVTAEYYRLRKNAAEEIVAKVLKEVSTWQDHAKKLGISRREIVAAEHLFIT
jgi:serine/threonine-protein kinase HipA